MLKYFRRLTKYRAGSRDSSLDEDSYPTRTSAGPTTGSHAAAPTPNLPSWQDPLTAPLRAACEAPDEGAILVARRLFEEVKVAPLLAADAARRAAFTEVLESFAELEAAVPGLRKAMLYRHPWMLRQLGTEEPA